MIGYEDEPIVMIEIDCVLPFTIIRQLMSSIRRRVWNCGQRRSVRQHGKPHHDCSSPALSVLPLEEAPGVKGLFELSGFEGDYHRYAEGNDLGEGMSRRV